MAATRHRIPTIFTLSMVDVLCCALGCVILLWLLNLRDARDRLHAAEAVSDELSQTRAELESTAKDSAATRSALDAALAERDRLRRALDAATARSTALVDELESARAERATLEDVLTKRARDLTNDLAAARKRADELDVLLRTKDAQARAASTARDDLAEKIRLLERRLETLQGQANLVPKLQDDVKATALRLAAAEARAAALERDLATKDRDLASRSRDLAEAEHRAALLSEKAKQAVAAAENRFAGIEMTGRRVVFLVDMSGSMEMVDEKTTAADKWSGVRETLVKIMRSLPDLEKFQVILFSSKATSLLGNDDRWLDFDAAAIDRVDKAMAATKPKGNTDMYAAFEAAFKFRVQGLDTIYLLSDGLPNVGQGVPPDKLKTMKENERTAVLSQHVRKTLNADWNRPLPGQPKVKINTVGFFYESPDVGAFLWALAREHDGSFVGMSKP
jgi:hypothetical protein